MDEQKRVSTSCPAQKTHQRSFIPAVGSLSFLEPRWVGPTSMHARVRRERVLLWGCRPLGAVANVRMISCYVLRGHDFTSGAVGGTRPFASSNTA